MSRWSRHSPCRLERPAIHDARRSLGDNTLLLRSASVLSGAATRLRSRSSHLQGWIRSKRARSQPRRTAAAAGEFLTWSCPMAIGMVGRAWLWFNLNWGHVRVCTTQSEEKEFATGASRMRSRPMGVYSGLLAWWREFGDLMLDSGRVSESSGTRPGSSTSKVQPGSSSSRSCTEMRPRSFRTSVWTM